MTRTKILVYDDDPRAAERFAAEIKKGCRRSAEPVEVEIISREDFHDDLAVLRRRQKDVRDEKTPDLADPRTCFDDADILVLDFDLSEYDEKGMIITGELVSYHARAFSDCGIIVSVNQFGVQFFDLTLQNHPELWAELNISDADLSTSTLWAQRQPRGFRPWSWPILPLLATQFEQMVNDVEQDIEANVCRFLGFPRDVVLTMPRDIASFIGKPEAASFKSVALSRAKPRDQKLPPYLISRFAASSVYRWLEYLVLPGQHVLVDAPHLISRYPSLLVGESRLKSAWNATAVLHDWSPSSVHTGRIEKDRFARPHWLSRVAWWADSISENREVLEVEKPWSYEKPRYVFAEDTSKFHNPRECQEFVAAANSPYSRRFIRRPRGVEVRYRPEVRLVM